MRIGQKKDPSDNKQRQCHPESEQGKGQKLVVVTSCYGYEVAKWIAMMGGTVVIACRSEDKAVEAIRRMNKEYRELLEKGTVGLVELEELRIEYMHLDLASFQSTKEFAEQFKKSGRQLHVLVCNAGVSKRQFEKTEDGFESTLQVNYLSHFFLIGQLLPVMTNNDDNDIRIVLVTSVAYRWADSDVTKMNYSGDPEKYSVLDCYGRTKLYQVMQMHCLKRRLRNTPISVTCVHPGMAETEIARDYMDSWTYRPFRILTRWLGISHTVLDGATTIIYSAISPDLKGVSGVYLENCKRGSESVASRDERKQEEIWRQTMEYLKDHFTEEERLYFESMEFTNR